MKNIFWAGSEESYAEYLAIRPKVDAMRAEFEARKEEDPEAEIEFPPIYELQGDVGVVTIAGTLIPGAAEFYRFFGYLGYDDIKSGLFEAVKDKGAKSILLNMDSPGGAVAGVDDALAFVRQVGQVKPMTAYAHEMCSAAYWLGSAASHITTGAISSVGSLGVLRVHTDVTKALAQDGITKTVLRAGRYKALGNPYEVLSDDARAEIQGQLDDLYDMFMSNVAENLGTSAEVVDQRMGQGRVFMGKRAVEAGLADAVGDVQAALAYAGTNRTLGAKRTVNFAAIATPAVVQATSIADNAATRTPTGLNMKLKLTTEQLAAVAAGASVEEATGMTTEQVAAAEAAAAKEGGDEEETTTTNDEPVASTETLNPEVVALTEQLATATAQVETLTAERDTATGRVTALEAEQAPLLAIARTVVKNLGTALNKTQDVDAMDATGVAAAHAELQPLFSKKYRVGSVAGSTASTDKPVEKKVALFSPRELAAAKAIPVPQSRK